MSPSAPMAARAVLRLVGRIVIMVAVVAALGAVPSVAASAYGGGRVVVVVDHDLRSAAC